MKWESTIRDLPALFRMMERAEKLGFTVKVTSLPDTQARDCRDKDEVFMEMYGDSLSSMAVFLQMLDAEGEMTLSKESKATMWRFINENIDSVAEEISWL